MIPPLLSTTALSCERGFRRLFSGINLQLNSCEMLKVIGANGAGKSTLLKILSGQNNDYEGQVFFRGEPLACSRHQFSRDVCFLGHNSGIKKNLTAVENLAFFSHLYPCKNNISIQQALARLQLGAFADSLCCELSQGQQQRVAFARFLLSDAVLWILDEPFTAIDRSGIEIIEQVMTDFLADDGAIIITSHHDVNVSAVQTLCLGAMP